MSRREAQTTAELHILRLKSWPLVKTLLHPDLKSQREKGKPGTGKTFTVCKAIQQHLSNTYRVAVGTPTGFLTSTYRGRFTEKNFSADTIHATFKYPVLSSEHPQVNWDLGNVNLLVLDELSMVPVQTFQHIIDTIQQLHIRPVLLLCGDD